MKTSDSEFFEDAFRRFSVILLSLLLAGMVVAFAMSIQVGLGFLLGAVVAAFNVYLLKRAITSLTGIAADGKVPPSVRNRVAGFFLRYILMAGALYVIVTSSVISVYGLFAGLFLPAGAILVEAGCQVFWTPRRTS